MEKIRARHRQLAERLQEEIESANYSIGSRFPTEHELQLRFGVSRYAVREALKILTEEGLLGRRQRTGTVVLAKRQTASYVHTLRDLTSLFDFARTTQLLDATFEYVPCPERTSHLYPDVADERWLRITGVRRAKRALEPLCWSEILVPERLAPDQAAIEEREGAVYELVLAERNLKFGFVEQEIRAHPFPHAHASALQVEAGSPSLWVERRYVASDGVTFEVSTNIYPWDRYSIKSVISKRI